MLVLARNARVAVRVDDGACPIGDGQTQEGKTVSITCVYNIDVPLEFEHKTKMKFEKYGLSSLVAIKTGLSETFSNPSKYYITEVKEGAYATRLDIRGESNSRQQCFLVELHVPLVSRIKVILHHLFPLPFSVTSLVLSGCLSELETTATSNILFVCYVKYFPDSYPS